MFKKRGQELGVSGDEALRSSSYFVDEDDPEFLALLRQEDQGRGGEMA